MGWESLAMELDLDVLTVVMGVNAFVVGANTVRIRVILPHNLSRGVVTMMRVRGMINNVFPITNLAISVTGRRLMTHAMNMQLVPVTNNTVVLDSVLDPANVTDQESNRVLWRHTYSADLNAQAGTDVGGLRFAQQKDATDLDVKSMRRWDRALWSLLLVSSYDTVEGFDHRLNLDIRGLFKASDGV